MSENRTVLFEAIYVLVGFMHFLSIMCLHVRRKPADGETSELVYVSHTSKPGLKIEDFGL